MSEKEIENQILSFLAVIGIMAWKNQSVGVYDPTKKIYRKPNNRHHIKGVSDILGLCAGRFLAIEVKSDKGRVSPEQRVFLARVNNEGGIGFVARSLEQVIDSLLPHLPNNWALKEFAKKYAIEKRELQT